MANIKSQNIRLGIFVLLGTFLMIAALYYIGSRQNLFGKTFRISARFHNVGGLMSGNNVRFSGIDVGTVESVEIIDDTSVLVVMIIEEDVRPFIKKNAIASVGTDGLMGNKLVNINSVTEIAESVEEGDELRTQPPIDLTEAMQTLSTTNKNLESITSNLAVFVENINSDNSLWNILTDSSVAHEIRAVVNNFRMTSEQSNLISGDLKKISADLRSGKGTAGTLISDTMMAYRLNSTITKLESFGDSVMVISADVATIINDLKSGKGTAGQLLNDTVLIHNLNNSLKEIENSAKSFDENMEALKHTWPLKKYYKKKQQQK